MSETRCPSFRSGLRAHLPYCPRKVPAYASALMPPLQDRLGWNDELRKGLMHSWVGLDEWSEYLSMLFEITQESITAPAPHDFHGLHWQAKEQVEQGGADTYPMTLEGLNAGQPGH